MAYEAKVIRDSMSPDGVRLTSIQATFPRFILAEVNTHRIKSRNSASSRAVPIEKRIAMVLEDPFVPAAFGKNQKGMQSETVLDSYEDGLARSLWQRAMEFEVETARKLAELGVHKQYANRRLETDAWHTALITATEWDNFFNQRCHKDAQPEFQAIAGMMCDAMERSQPILLERGEWHLPYVSIEEEVSWRIGKVIDPVKVAVGRCARTSYLTQDGVRDPAADVALYDRLLNSGHMSPTEHAARPAEWSDRDIATIRVADIGQAFEMEDVTKLWFGNFQGWVQHRKQIPGEAVFHG